MSFVIGLIVGIALGAAIAYFLTSKKTATQSAAVQDLHRQLALAESEHERRLREATEQLRKDYGTEAQSAGRSTSAPVASTPPTSAPPPAASTAPGRMASPPPASTIPTAPLPTPTPNPPTPEISEPPVTATAPAPMPQSVMPSPLVPDEPRKSPAKALETSVQISDPNAVLAASYSPDADTRSEVAKAIAKILPTAGAPAQARWFPVLGRLARDPVPQVRLSAVQALAQVKSAKRLPLLQRALKDADPAVVQAASAIISQTKGRSQTPQSAPKRRLPKNQ